MISEDTHYFYIADLQFKCDREQWGLNGHMHWLPSVDINSDWGIDSHKAFRTKEACEKYIRKQVIRTAKEILKYSKLKD